MDVAGFARTPLRMFSAVFVWVAHFMAIYGFTALACARALAGTRWLGVGIVPWMIVAATLLAVAAAAAILFSALRAADSSSFERWITAGIAALALVAIVWAALPVLIVPVC